MKKIKYCLALALVTVLFSSCLEEKDNWYTNTKEYDGRYSVAITCDEYSDHDQTIKAGYELLIYNSAANVENQIIIDSKVAIDTEHSTYFAIKGKFDVEGNISGFKATKSTTNIAASVTDVNDDEFRLLNDDGTVSNYVPSDLDDPEVAGEEYEAIQFYARVSIDEGKITPKGATTIGGNVSDGVYLVITTYPEKLVIESYQLPESKWAVPGVAEFGWRVKAGSRTEVADSELIEHWKFEGYRYTGYPEDNPSTKPPITEN